MRKNQRLSRVAAAAMMAALAVSVAACGSDTPQATPPSSSAAAPSPSSEASAAGITTPKQAFGPACQQLPQGGVPGSALKMAGQPVAAAAATNPLLKTLTTAVQKAGIADTLNSAKAATVFAPYDDAFTDLQQRIGPDRFNALLADKNALGDILKYHVVVKRYDRAGLAAAGTVTTLQGGNLTITDAGDTMNIKDNANQTAHVLCGNLPTANATVFVIDRVMMPKDDQ
ncbi:fasciclin domain-containing protein [Pseudonocardia spinosispora]|uniref:fasciclin domain-containing protein n=1 Tax=Pseudonocardia spinosispora TaxID=103441 RepID=UPI0003FEEB84|nr:fasciclin domain-containing protein [Pseudonocardia spinosispora]